MRAAPESCQSGSALFPTGEHVTGKCLFSGQDAICPELEGRKARRTRCLLRFRHVPIGSAEVAESGAANTQLHSNLAEDPGVALKGRVPLDGKRAVHARSEER